MVPTWFQTGFYTKTSHFSHFYRCKYYRFSGLWWQFIQWKMNCPWCAIDSLFIQLKHTFSWLVSDLKMLVLKTSLNILMHDQCTLACAILKGISIQHCPIRMAVCVITSLTFSMVYKYCSSRLTKITQGIIVLPVNKLIGNINKKLYYNRVYRGTTLTGLTVWYNNSRPILDLQIQMSRYVCYRSGRYYM